MKFEENKVKMLLFSILLVTILVLDITVWEVVPSIRNTSSYMACNRTLT